MKLRNAFTMVELVFVIVILGVLVAFAIPKLAATREDAQVTTLRAMLKQVQTAVPAHYLGRHVASFKGAMVIKTSSNPAARNVFILDATGCNAVYTDRSGDTLTMQIVNNAGSAPSVDCTEDQRAVDENLSLLITYTFTPNTDHVISQVAKLNNIANSGDFERFALSGSEVKR